MPPSAQERVWSARSSRMVQGAALFGVLALALLVRVSPLPHARTDVGWRFTDGDSYYHLYRIEQTLRSGRPPPTFEPRLSYPEGLAVQWHAGYDLAVAGLVVLRCGATPSRSCFEDTAAWSTPALGVLATLATWLLALALVGPWPALLAALLFAVYPFSAGSAALGHVDHHVLEPFCSAVWLTLLALGRPWLAGLAAGASLAVFSSALWPVGVTFAALALDRIAALARATGRAWTCTAFAAGAAVASLPIALTGAFPDRLEPSSTSLFHVFALTAAAASSTAVEFFAARAAARRPLRALTVHGAAGLLLALALREPLAALARFSRAEGLWTGVVQQQSLAAGPGAALVLVALVLAAGSATYARGVRTASLALRVVALAGVPLTLAGIVQMRFLMTAAPLLVVMLTLLVLEPARALGKRLASAPARTRWLARIVPFGLALLLLAPLREYVGAGTPVTASLTDGIALLERLGRNPPADRTGSILADWTWGHHVVYLTPFAAVANPFMLSGEDRANVEVRLALTDSHPAPLEALLRARASRYLLVTSHFDPALAARSVGREPPTDPVAERLSARELEGWPELRLADAERGARLYERVRGAKLVGAAAPGADVVATLALSPQGAPTLVRRFHARADADGRYAIHVAEWNRPSDRLVRTSAAYSLGDCSVVVSERSARAGLSVATRCP